MGTRVSLCYSILPSEKVRESAPAFIPWIPEGLAVGFISSGGNPHRKMASGTAIIIPALSFLGSGWSNNAALPRAGKTGRWHREVAGVLTPAAVSLLYLLNSSTYSEFFRRGTSSTCSRGDCSESEVSLVQRPRVKIPTIR